MKKIVLIDTYGGGGDKLSSHLAPGTLTGPHFPLGVVSIASYLKNNLPRSFVRILDERILLRREIETELNEIKPDIVGISCVFKNYSEALDLARSAKQNGAEVVLGGHYATAMAREILTNRGPGSTDYCVDTVVKQDGEKAFYQYAKGEPKQNINNLVYRHNHKIIENPIELLDLNKLPDLRLSDVFNPEIYFGKYQKNFPNSRYKNPFIIYSQKGCGWRDKPGGGCLFCSIMYSKLRLRKPKIVWDEIERLVSDYGVDYIWDVADNFLSDKKWFEEFYREFLRRRFKKPFFKIQARADDLVSEEIVEMLGRLNVVQIFIGFESDDNACLKQIRKGTSPFINKKAISVLKKHKIGVMAYFLLGLPGETEESLARTVKLAEEVVRAGDKNYLIIPLFVPISGSRSFQFLIEKTGKKYIGADIINWNEAFNDWVKYFCGVSSQKIIKAQNYLRKLCYNPMACPY